MRARVNARACIAITLRTSRKSITIQLCLAQRKMIRTVGAHLYFRLSFGAIICYNETSYYAEKVHNNLDMGNARGMISRIKIYSLSSQKDITHTYTHAGKWEGNLLF